MSPPAEAGFAATLSVTGRAWRIAPADAALTARLAAAHGLPEPAARLLAARGIAEPERFLKPTLRALLPDPSTLRDMDKAAARLAEAVRAGETVGVLTDYDVDGATSAAVIIRTLEALGAKTALQVPDRLVDGYGPNLGALRRLRDEGASVSLCLDCGATAHAALTAANDEGMAIIVIDHHKADGPPPPALAVVNPNRPDDESGMGGLAAVGVTFLACVALVRALRAAAWFGVERPEPDLMALLDLVALGTVADVVPLLGLNRAFVAQGLKVMADTAHPGLDALMRVSGVSGPPETQSLGYRLGPRINAGGRVGRADHGARLLLAADRPEAEALALALDADNARRREIEAETLAQAQADAAAQGHAPLVIVGRQGWHPGVIGICAGRLKDALDKPALVIAWDGEAGKGSGRAPAGCDLGAAMIAARAAGLLQSGGGHAAAAGFALTRPQFEGFTRFMTNWAAAAAPAAPELPIDGALTPAGASLALVQALFALAPYGAGFPEPRFAVSGTLSEVRSMGAAGQHLRLRLRSHDGAALEAVCFGAFAIARNGDSLGAALQRLRDQRAALAGRLSRNEWNGRVKAQLVVDDAMAEPDAALSEA